MRNLAKPARRNYFVYFSKYLAVIVGLLFFAWLQGNILLAIVPNYINFPLSFALLLLILWLYCIENRWMFDWEGNDIKVCLLENILTNAKIKISINSKLVLEISLWNSKEFQAERIIEYNDRNLKVLVGIIPDMKSNQVCCFLEVNENK